MAELATIARPYAEALSRAGWAAGADAQLWKQQLSALAQLAADPALRRFADDPQVQPVQVFDLIAGIALGQGVQIDPKVGNLLRAVLDNGRLAALPEMAQQYAAIVNAGSGVSDAVVTSAFPLDDRQLADVVAALERRFGRRLAATVQVDPELIGGIRVAVGDEVLDTSVKARLEQMKVALTA